MSEIFNLREGDMKSGLIDLISYVNQELDNKVEMIEIGSYKGESTVLFAQNFHRIVAVDPWLDGYDEADWISTQGNLSEIEVIFDTNVKLFANVEKVKAKSDDACLLIKPPVNFIYIDGVHTYDQVKKDIKNYAPRFLYHRHGFIAGHDYEPEMWPGVYKAVNECFGKPDKVFKDTSWLVKM